MATLTRHCLRLAINAPMQHNQRFCGAAGALWWSVRPPPKARIQQDKCPFIDTYEDFLEAETPGGRGGGAQIDPLIYNNGFIVLGGNRLRADVGCTHGDLHKHSSLLAHR